MEATSNVRPSPSTPMRAVPIHSSFPEYGFSVDSKHPHMLHQPYAPGFSEQNLRNDVSSIWKDLVLFEAMCIHIDGVQIALIKSASEGDRKKSDTDWSFTNQTHFQLLNLHADFFLATQSSVASAEIQNLAQLHEVPTRLWTHGIQSYMDVLKHGLPTSSESLKRFLHFSYGILKCLLETSATFRTTWVERLGDLGRYGMTIDASNRQEWLAVAEYWYGKVPYHPATCGRVLHHLALVTANKLRKLWLFSCALTCTKQFPVARQSFTTFLQKISCSLPRLSTAYIKLHIMLFEHKLNSFDCTLQEVLHLFRANPLETRAFVVQEGAGIIISAISTLFNHGCPNSALRKLVEHTNRRILQPKAINSTEGHNEEATKPCLEPYLSDHRSNQQFRCAVNLFSRFTEIALRQEANVGVDRGQLLLVNLVLTFYHSLMRVHSFNLAHSGRYIDPILSQIPREDICVLGNKLLKAGHLDFADGQSVPPHNLDPLPEDHIVRSQLWAELFFPTEWSDGADDEDFERASIFSTRANRAIWLLHWHARVSRIIV